MFLFSSQSGTRRTDTHLCTQTGRTQRLYDAVRVRMTRPQVTWGEHLDIFTEPWVARNPLILRRALAFEKLLLEMPIVIEEDELIVGTPCRMA